MKSLDIHSAVSKSKFPLGLPMISNDPVFVSERGAPLSAPGFSSMIERAAVVAKHGIKAYAQMLHCCTIQRALR